MHIKNDVMTAEQKAKAAAIAVKNAIFHTAPKVEWAAGELWKGANWCDARPQCKTEVTQFGEAAVKLALKRHAESQMSLQELWGLPGFCNSSSCPVGLIQMI